jgi:hypothetical protein
MIHWLPPDQLNDPNTSNNPAISSISQRFIVPVSLSSSRASPRAAQLLNFEVAGLTAISRVKKP